MYVLKPAFFAIISCAILSELALTTNFVPGHGCGIMTKIRRIKKIPQQEMGKDWGCTFVEDDESYKQYMKKTTISLQDYIKQNKWNAKLRCQGEDDDCCTITNPCEYGDGDCDSDNECAGDLVCGFDNCPNGSLKFSEGDDCCTTKMSNIGSTSGKRCKGRNNGCCTTDNPCDDGDGDCDSDDECLGSLVCLESNCPSGYYEFDATDDCCGPFRP